jgi:hypothetical protein
MYSMWNSCSCIEALLFTSWRHLLKKLLAVSVLATALLFVAGCAGDDAGDSETSTTVVTVDRFILQPVTMEVMLKPNISQPEIDSMVEEIEGRDDVEEVLYTSQEEVLEILRKRLGDDKDLLPADLAWELSPTVEITLNEDADIEAIALELADDPIVDNSPGTKDGVEYQVEPWRLELRNDETFLLFMDDKELTGSYKIFRDSIALVEETGEFGIYEGEITGTAIKFEAFPGTWEKE